MSTSEHNPTQSETGNVTRAPYSRPIWMGGRGDKVCKGKFNIEVVSVGYYAEEESYRAAVVLKTSFILHDGRQLKYAMCPVAVHSLPGESPEDQIHIVQYCPINTESVAVEYRPGQTQWMFNPSVSLGPVAAQVGQVSQTQSKNKACVITLDAVHRQEQNPSIEWYYRDKEKSRYPSSVHLLVVLRNARPSWFKFRLQVTASLKVDVHSNLSQPFTNLKDRYVGQPETGDGWYFKIQGRYEEHIAARALNSDPSVPPSVGLKAAAVLDVSNTYTGQ